MTTINLELRGVKWAKYLSEETPAYQASLYLDGKKVANVDNEGHGGPDRVHWLDNEARKRIDAYFASQPGEIYHGIEMKPNLELWCHETLYDQDMVKAVKRAMKRSAYGLHGDKEYLWKIDPAKIDQRFLDHVEKKYPGAVILNGKSDAEILSLIKAHQKR